MRPRQPWRLKNTTLDFLNQECTHKEKAGCRNERRRQWSEEISKLLNWAVRKSSWTPRPCWPKSIHFSSLYSGVDNLIFAGITWIRFLFMQLSVTIYSLGLVENYIRQEGGDVLREKCIKKGECLWKLRAGEARIRVWVLEWWDTMVDMLDCIFNMKQF